MLERRKLHLINPTTGERKWFLPASAMVAFFAGLLFPFITRRLWGWLVVWLVGYVMLIVVALAQDDLPSSDVRAFDRAFQFVFLGLTLWACLVANKQATRKLLARGWLVSSDTLEEAWQFFQKKWKLPDSARQGAALAMATPAAGPMPGMVFCRGCGHRIHETAPTCPQCGAPQLASKGALK